ncbi:MAG: hypothetical protein HY302_04335 [Opitutae bacterium]|nr:hypothetical protein [Opitutae bacterium]
MASSLKVHRSRSGASTTKAGLPLARVKLCPCLQMWVNKLTCSGCLA